MSVPLYCTVLYCSIVVCVCVCASKLHSSIKGSLASGLPDRGPSSASQAGAPHPPQEVGELHSPCRATLNGLAF